jgi:competence protein ComGC
MEFFKELLLFLKTRKKFWLIPLVVILVLFSVLIILASVPALGPFIYSLF